jgi:hypothetical protein
MWMESISGQTHIQDNEKYHIPGIRVLDGFFQAVSTRTAGFGVVNLSELHPSIQVRPEKSHQGHEYQVAVKSLSGHSTAEK